MQKKIGTSRNPQGHKVRRNKVCGGQVIFHDDHVKIFWNIMAQKGFYLFGVSFFSFSVSFRNNFIKECIMGNFSFFFFVSGVGTAGLLRHDTAAVRGGGGAGGQSTCRLRA